MRDETLLLLILAVGLGLLYQWGFRVLPRHHWQILFVVPVKEGEVGREQAGINFTWYGFWSATAAVSASLWLMVLLGAVGASLMAVGLLVGGLVLLCVPAASWIARLVERKAHTRTVAGAAFTGFLAAPILISCINVLPGTLLGKTGAVSALPFFPALAGLGIALALGEGMGRLACLSFGCCYGRPIASLPSRWGYWLGRIAVQFTSPLKKAVYAGGAETGPLVPIQALTCTVLTTTSLLGAWFFLAGRFRAALFLTLIVTQAWRFVSEFLRNDERGQGNLTTYQLMAVLLLAGLLLLMIVPTQSEVPAVDLSRGWKQVWQIEIVLFLELLWIALFVHLGRSQVTGARLSLFLHRDRL
jgi:hypothetical protein